MRDSKSSPLVHSRARQQRRVLTEAEAVLWQQLRSRRLGGFKFRRQHPIGRFIADFCCPATGVIVEADGKIHQFQKEYDTARTDWLEQQGYTVIRYTNEQILNSTEQVALEILNYCKRIAKERRKK